MKLGRKKWTQLFHEELKSFNTLYTKNRDKTWNTSNYYFTCGFDPKIAAKLYYNNTKYYL